MEEWAGSIFALRQLFSSCGPHGLCSGEGLSLCQHGSASRDLESAALSLECAVPLRGICFQFGVDLTDPCNSLFGIAPGIGGLVGIAFAHGRLEIELNLKKRKSGTESGKEIEG